MAAEDISCFNTTPDDENHIWLNWHPRYDFDYRQCLKCNRLQYIIDKDTYYDPKSNQYVDRKGCHNVSDLVGYNE